MTVALASLAQLFLISTKANQSARLTTTASVLAQQKMEQLRGLTWGFDIIGLPLSDTTSDLTVVPEQPQGGPGLTPSPEGSLQSNVDGYRRFPRRPRPIARRRFGRAAQHGIRAALVGRAAADESEQHADPAGDGDALARARRGRHRKHRRRAQASRRSAHHLRQNAKGKLMRRHSREHGFSLIEMTVSMGLMIVVTGSIFALLNPGQGNFVAEPEVADMQQRTRVAADTLYKDLVMVGSGSYAGDNPMALSYFFAPVMPFRQGRLQDDPPGTFRTDAITLMMVPATTAQSSHRPADAGEVGRVEGD